MNTKKLTLFGEPIVSLSPLNTNDRSAIVIITSTTYLKIPVEYCAKDLIFYSSFLSIPPCSNIELKRTRDLK